MEHRIFCVILAVLCKSDSICALNELLPTFSVDTLQAQYGIIEYAGLIFRHGDRTPIELYPTDPYQNYAWPANLGDLTNQGKEREYILGKYFEPRYNCLTGEAYMPTRVIMHSSNMDRCLASAELFFAGYFPPFGTEIWNPQLLWQPVPVHSTPAENDNVIGMTKPCPLRDLAVQDFYRNSPVVRSVCNNFAAMLLYIQNYTGLNMADCPSQETARNLIVLQDTLLAESQLKLQLPDWANAVFPEPLNSLRSLLLSIEAEDPIVAKFNAGPILSVIASDMLNIAAYNNSIPPILYSSNRSNVRPLHLFSAHDVTILTVMRALNMYQNVSPDYGAALGFELRSRDNSYYVTAVYENSVLEPLKVLQIPGCPGGCSLSNFLALIRPLIPENWDLECQIVDTIITPPSASSSSQLPTYFTDFFTTASPTLLTEPTEPTFLTIPTRPTFQTRPTFPSLPTRLTLPTHWTPPAVLPSHPSNGSVISNPVWDETFWTDPKRKFNGTVEQVQNSNSPTTPKLIRSSPNIKDSNSSINSIDSILLNYEQYLNSTRVSNLNSSSNGQ